MSASSLTIEKGEMMGKWRRRKDMQL